MRRRQLLITLLLACGIALLCGCSKASEKVAAQGTCGTCSWEISLAGKLVIRPTEGDEGTLELWEISEKVPWNDSRDKIKSCGFEGTVHARTCLSMFEECTNLTTVDTTGFDTSEVADMGKMFKDCDSLESLDTSGWNTSHVANMGEMFDGCRHLKTIDVSSWDTSRVTDMSETFSSCYGLGALDVSSWDTSHVKSMEFMLSGCALGELDVSSWDTSQVESAYCMFLSTHSLSNFTVGEGYKFVSEDMFPEGSGEDQKWRSEKDGKLYTRSEICSGRSGVADTYTCDTGT